MNPVTPRIRLQLDAHWTAIRRRITVESWSNRSCNHRITILYVSSHYIRFCALQKCSLVLCLQYWIFLRPCRIEVTRHSARQCCPCTTFDFRFFSRDYLEEPFGNYRPDALPATEQTVSKHSGNTATRINMELMTSFQIGYYGTLPPSQQSRSLPYLTHLSEKGPCLIFGSLLQSSLPQKFIHRKQSLLT